MAAVNTFQSTITFVRDILRAEGITGADSMRHICLYVVARYMTLEHAKMVGFPAKFAWENMIDVLRGDAGVQLAYDLFCDGEHGYFLASLDRMFETSDFTFSLSNVRSHAKIMEAMDKVDIHTIDHRIDILGYIYEEHVSTGSIPPRDLGQFFTDRAVCKYMVSLCNPRIKGGLPETICDPTMGTGGFLTTAIKHYTTLDPQIDWQKHIDTVQGCDIDGRVAAIARMNIFMETNGVRPTKLASRNSLYDGLPASTYDIILANIPFGINNIDYERCYKSVRDLGIKSSDPESLFLQLIMASLGSSGRAAVIMPSGFIGGMDKQIIRARQYLVENFQLTRVIEMKKGDFFMNTSVGTYILLFSAGFATSSVHVSRISRGPQDQPICEEVVGVIKRKHMASKNFSLFANHYTKQTVLLTVASAGASVRPLSELCNILAGKQIDKHTYVSDGLAVVMHKNFADGKLIISDNQQYVAHDAPDKHIRLVPDDIVVSAVFDCGKCARIESPGWILHNHVYLIRVIDTRVLLPEYLFYAMYYGGFHDRMRVLQSGSTIQHIRRGDIEEYLIAIYSIDEQRRIVAWINESLARKNTLRKQIEQIEQSMRDCDADILRRFA